MAYKAFISYSHAADGRLAPSLQSGLHQFAKPWYRLRAIRTFRDKTSLTVTPGLWRSIERALGESEYFIMLASPEAAASRWVRQEIDYWLTNRPVEKIFIVLTGGELTWGKVSSGADESKTTAIPPSLQNACPDEPLYLDLRWARTEEHLSLRDPRFRESIATLAAPLHGRPKDELIGEDVRQHRRAKRLAWSAIIVLLALTLISVVAACLAVQQGRLATKRAQIAEERRRLATARRLVAEAELTRTGQPNLLERSVLLAVEAVRRFHELDLPSSEADQALRRGLAQLPRHVARMKHKTTVNTFTFSPDGRYLATCVVDTQHVGYPVMVWDATNGTEVTRVETGSRVTDLDFSPDGKYLATAGAFPQVWEITGGTEVSRLDYDGYLTALVFSPDGGCVASASKDHSARLWDWQEGRELLCVNHEDEVHAVVFSPDGRCLATISADETTRIWELPHGQELGQMAYAPSSANTHLGPHTPRTRLTFSPDSNYLATAGTDGTVRIWDAAGGRELSPLKHAAPVRAVAFSPNSEHLVTGSQDGTARAWEVASGREYLRPMYHGDAVNVVAFSPDSGYLLTAGADGTARVWEATKRGAELARIGHGGDHLVDWERQERFDVSAASFSPDGKYVATASSRNTNVWQVLDRLGHVGRIFNLGIFALSPNGRHLVGTPGWSVAAVSEIPSGRMLKEVSHADHVSELSFSADGDYVASSSGRIVKVWRATGDGEVVELSHRSSVKDIVFSPDGKHLATETRHFKNDSPGTFSLVHVWDWTEGREVAQMPVGGPIRVMAFSENGDYLAAISRESADRSVGKTTAWLWNPAKGEDIGHVPCDSGITSVIYTREEGLQAIADSANVPVKTVGRAVMVRFPQSTLTRDGRYMVTKSGEFVLVKEVASGQEIVRIAHEPELGDVSFSPDDRYVVTDSWSSQVSDNRYVRFWLWRSQDLVAEACSRLSRDLTQDEWKRYIGNDEPYRSVRTPKEPPPD